MAVLDDIIYKKPNKNPTIDCDNSEYELPFYKDGEYFAILDNFVNFCKACERLVRVSPYYKKYISYLRTIGLDRCQVLSNIVAEEGGPAVEMHHGPILSLFDYCAIVTDHLIYHKKLINTFIVADIIIKEHYNNNIQVVMLSETVHQSWHATGKPFINLHQAFGDLNKFMKKYRDGLEEVIPKINRYIMLSTKYDSFDSQLLKIKDNIEVWGYTDIN